LFKILPLYYDISFYLRVYESTHFHVVRVGTEEKVKNKRLNNKLSEIGKCPKKEQSTRQVLPGGLKYHFSLKLKDV